MAGKRVKCPKCNDPLTIPMAKAASPAATPSAGITDLLDEVGVRGARLGPACPECGADVQPGAILCIQCGYNFAMGRRMYTEADDSQYQDAHGESNAEKLLAKAERELDEAPISAEGEDFGDGPEAFLIAGAAAVVASILSAIAIYTIFVLDAVPSGIVMLISLGASFVFCIIGLAWITVVAFLEHVLRGLTCLGSVLPGPILAAFLTSLLFHLIFADEGTTAIGFMIGWQAGMSYIYFYAATRSLWIPLMMVSLFSFLFCILWVFAVANAE